MLNIPYRIIFSKHSEQKWINRYIGEDKSSNEGATCRQRPALDVSHLPVQHQFDGGVGTSHAMCKPNNVDHHQ